jgi:hypothetical protein
MSLDGKHKPNKSFFDLLKQGEEYEDAVINFLEHENNIKCVERRKDNLYDFAMDNGVRYECKNDEASQRTGKYFIEFEQSRKPSGIVVTHADIYVLGTYEDTIFIDVSVLKECIDNKEYIKRYESPQKSGYIFNVSTLRCHCHLHCNLVSLEVC